MRRYFFDVRNGGSLSPDEDGIELPTMEAVQEEAVRSLAEMVRDAVPGVLGSSGHRVVIEVRNETGPVMKALFTFEAPKKP